MQAMALAEAWYEATERLCELVNDSIDGCLAIQAIRGMQACASGLVTGLVMELHRLLKPCATASVNTVCAAAAKRWALMGDVADDRPYMWCGDASNHATMVLCDRCSACYHPW